MIELLKSESNNFGIKLSDVQLEKFKKYMDFLLEYNSHTNLTAIKTPEDVAIKHFLDSIAFTKFLNIKSSDSIIDIGTGAGFPGVPIKILKDDVNLTLLDSLKKRTVFLEKLCDELDLKNVKIISGRAEEISRKKEFREKFNFCVSRAVAPLNILCEYCLPYVNPGGCFVALKGPSADDEYENSKNAISCLGGKLEKIEKFELPLNKGERSVVVIKKAKPISSKYPRSNSQISKNPL